MKQFNIIIAGCGDVGSTLALQLIENKHNVTGLRRNIDQLPDGIQGISIDMTNLDNVCSNLQHTKCDILVYAAAATQRDARGYRSAYIDGFNHVLDALPEAPKHIFFTSSTGVYHQNDHSWVNEDSPCAPSGFTGQIMLEAEANVLSKKIPATVVRFSGIYGPKRGYLMNRVKDGDGAPLEPRQYSNRIHRDDCAGVLNHLISLISQGQSIDSCYLASDDTPVTMHEVTQWLAKEMKVDINTETASRRAGSKRCNNERIKATGYRFKYPSFKEGYQALITEH